MAMTRSGLIMPILFGSALCGALVACGGESDNSADTTAAGSGNATSSGGSSSSGSSTGTSSGSGAMGGSGGMASSTSDSTTTNATGGSGGVMNPVPPPGLVQSCASFCDAAQAVDCPNQETPEECAESCNVLTRVPACSEALETLFACAQDGELVCDADGEATVTGCAAEELDAFACVLNEAPDPAMIEACESYCSLQLDAMCENEEDTEEECVLGCASIGTIFPTCKPEWQSLVDCGLENGVECDESGEVQPVGCDVEGLQALLCLVENSE